MRKGRLLLYSEMPMSSNSYSTLDVLTFTCLLATFALSMDAKIIFNFDANLLDLINFEYK